jgi:hypothetical protein
VRAAGTTTTTPRCRYRQCWLKYDNVSTAAEPTPTGQPTWPRSLQLREEDTGWMSGTTEPGFVDGAGADWGYSYCTCTNYTMEGYRFQVLLGDCDV